MADKTGNPVRGALSGMVTGSGWTKSDNERKWYNDRPDNHLAGLLAHRLK